MKDYFGKFFRFLATLVCVMILTGCGLLQKPMDGSTEMPISSTADYEYTIGPGDRMNIFVWRNPDVSVIGVPVRPDGMISTPLVEEMPAAGKRPVQLARDIEQKLSQYIQDPLVTVTVVSFTGEMAQQIRVVGEVATPIALPYIKNMTLLDVMIVVGGLTEFAAGNKTVVVRRTGGMQSQINVRLEDLLKGGDISANIAMEPGDIIVIPESLF